ncbi:MAG TPA: phosphoribosylanthranilate isomerase, partial [Pyrinomonadaceae bacterium]
HAARLGADLLGFIFYERSSRYIEPQAARDIAEKIPEAVIKVGVFVNMEGYRIDEVVSMVGLDAVQIHGDENDSFPSELRSETQAQIIKACRITSDRSTWPIAETNANYFLLDSYSPEYGGSGRTFDWSIVEGLNGLRERIILAGGLNADNVAEAVRIVRPYAVDVASGVESSPGKKDPKKVAAFIKAAKDAI